jgi:hypothetical protein
VHRDVTGTVIKIQQKRRHIIFSPQANNDHVVNFKLSLSSANTTVCRSCGNRRLNKPGHGTTLSQGLSPLSHSTGQPRSRSSCCGWVTCSILTASGSRLPACPLAMQASSQCLLPGIRLPLLAPQAWPFLGPHLYIPVHVCLFACMYVCWLACLCVYDYAMIVEKLRQLHREWHIETGHPPHSTPSCIFWIYIRVFSAQQIWRVFRVHSTFPYQVLAYGCTFLYGWNISPGSECPLMCSVHICLPRATLASLAWHAPTPTLVRSFWCGCPVRISHPLSFHTHFTDSCSFPIAPSTSAGIWDSIVCSFLPHPLSPFKVSI